LQKLKACNTVLGTENRRSIRPEKPALKIIRNLVNQFQTPDDEAIFNQALTEYEQQHPHTSIEDLLAINKQLPEDTPFARAINQVKRI
jgi:hypothetical protein